MMRREGGLRLIARRWWEREARRSCKAEGVEAGAEVISRDW